MQNTWDRTNERKKGYSPVNGQTRVKTFSFRILWNVSGNTNPMIGVLPTAKEQDDFAGMGGMP